MASHSLAIAKASLAASMMKPDPHPVPKAEISAFYDHLESLLEYCSSKNIQVRGSNLICVMRRLRIV